MTQMTVFNIQKFCQILMRIWILMSLQELAHPVILQDCQLILIL